MTRIISTLLAIPLTACVFGHCNDALAKRPPSFDEIGHSTLG